MLTEIEKYYVYALCYPDKEDPFGLLANEPFYVGKGSGNRSQAHLTNELRGENIFKDRVIDKIRRSGFEPVILYFKKHMIENAAYDLEETNIKLYGRKCNNSGILTNIIESGRPPRLTGKDHPYYDKPGPTTGFKWAEEQLSKITGKNHWTKSTPYPSGFHRDKEYIQRMKAKGRKVLNTKPVTIIDMELNIQHNADCLTHWCKDNDINYRSFRNAVKNGRLFHERYSYRLTNGK